MLTILSIILNLPKFTGFRHYYTRPAKIGPLAGNQSGGQFLASAEFKALGLSKEIPDYHPKEELDFLVYCLKQVLNKYDDRPSRD